MSVFEVLFSMIVTAVLLFLIYHYQDDLLTNVVISAQQIEAIKVAHDTLPQVKKTSHAQGSTVVQGQASRYTVNWTEEDFRHPIHRTVYIDVSWTGKNSVVYTVAVLDNMDVVESTDMKEMVDEI